MADAVCFLYDTRLRFLVNGNTDNKGAPLACAMIYWGDDFSAFESVFSAFGAVVSLESLKKSRQNARQRQKAREMFLFDFNSLKPRRRSSAADERAASACCAKRCKRLFTNDTSNRPFMQGLNHNGCLT